VAGLTLQQLWQQGDAAFERSHLRPGDVKAVGALRAGRAARSGGHVQACPAGHGARVWDQAGRHRLCPHCRGRQSARWLVRQKTRRLACDHAQARCTRPDALRGLGLVHVQPMTALWCAAVRETWYALGAQVDDLGVMVVGYLGHRDGIFVDIQTDGACASVTQGCPPSWRLSCLWRCTRRLWLVASSPAVASEVSRPIGRHDVQATCNL
jgi:hypothetical protein